MQELSREQQHHPLDFYQVRVQRPGGPEFVAHESYSEEESLNTFLSWQHAVNVERVEYRVNGNLNTLYRRHHENKTV